MTTPPEEKAYCTIDYLRLGTWDFKAYLDLVELLHSPGHHLQDWTPRKWLQYKGKKNGDGIFYGLGEQNGDGHGIVQVSGGQAHIFTDWLFGNLDKRQLAAWYCTRIDLAANKMPPEGWNYETAYKRIKNPKKLILSETGSTLYVGNRSSDSFWRIYDKAENLIRVEVEKKGKQAQKTWLAIVATTSIPGLFSYDLAHSRLPKIIVQHFQGLVSPVKPEDLVEPEDLTKKLDWLATLDNMVYKLVNDHDAGPRAREIVARWAQYSQNLDTIETKDDN